MMLAGSNLGCNLSGEALKEPRHELINLCYGTFMKNYLFFKCSDSLERAG